ncbi:hypothetical protein D3C80_2050080 [compost metagenome]
MMGRYGGLRRLAWCPEIRQTRIGGGDQAFEQDLERLGVAGTELGGDVFFHCLGQGQLL